MGFIYLTFQNELDKLLFMEQLKKILRVISISFSNNTASYRVKNQFKSSFFKKSLLKNQAFFNFFCFFSPMWKSFCMHVTASPKDKTVTKPSSLT